MTSSDERLRNLRHEIICLLMELEQRENEEAVMRLEALDREQVFPILQQLLAEQSYKRFDIVLYALAHIDKPAFFDAARQLLTHPQEDIRWYVCEMLSEYRADSIWDTLLQVAQNDTTPDVRCSAILALATWPDQRILPVLQQIASHDTGITTHHHSIAEVATRAIVSQQSLTYVP